MISEYEYVGSELELFARARNWKSYLASEIRGYLKGDVLEVGAGLGVNTSLLRTPAASCWLCLEPDDQMYRLLAGMVDGQAGIGAFHGTLEDLPQASSFDSIVYVDVLEHIDDDAAELGLAGQMLRPGGVLVVLAPAHQKLFSEFDSAIGHFRRYNKKTLAALQPPSTKLEALRYLDSVGLLASLGNRFLLRQPLPSPKQIAFWDKWLVPASRLVDRLTVHSIGKSVLAVWRRDLAPTPRSALESARSATGSS